VVIGLICLKDKCNNTLIDAVLHLRLPPLAAKAWEKSEVLVVPDQEESSVLLVGHI
jgi:hypothetical protein